jgi:hypothetical protein
LSFRSEAEESASVLYPRQLLRGEGAQARGCGDLGVGFFFVVDFIVAGFFAEDGAAW